MKGGDISIKCPVEVQIDGYSESIRSERTCPEKFTSVWCGRMRYSANFSPQSDMSCITGSSFLPSSVSEYSTFGGITS